MGFKNGTDGNMRIAVDAIRAASRPPLPVGDRRATAIVVHHGQRGLPRHPARRQEPNFDAPTSMRRAGIAAAGLAARLMVDFSHGNSRKQYKLQMDVSGTSWPIRRRRRTHRRRHGRVPSRQAGGISRRISRSCAAERHRRLYRLGRQRRRAGQLAAAVRARRLVEAASERRHGTARREPWLPVCVCRGASTAEVGAGSGRRWKRRRPGPQVAAVRTYFAIDAVAAAAGGVGDAAPAPAGADVAQNLAAFARNRLVGGDTGRFALQLFAAAGGEKRPWPLSCR